MRTIVIGLGIQGRKRREHCGDDFVYYVDPNIQAANYRTAYDVPLDSFDAACVCTPNSGKLGIIRHLIEAKKHVLVEKPLWWNRQKEIKELQYLATKNKCILYTAYNHRFEPALIEAKDLIDSGKLGKIYHCRMFYGNGTAKLVKESPWRDSGIGIFGEIGSHLLDLTQFLFGGYKWFQNVDLISSACFENKTPDHIVFEVSNGDFSVECEATYCSWKNTFTLDILGEKGSLHVNGFCKWSRSISDNTLEWRKRIYPSGVPETKNLNWWCPDPTWKKEYEHFKFMCDSGLYVSTMQINDLEINFAINSLVEQSERKQKWRASYE